MSDFLINDGLLEAYLGTSSVVVVPDGVTRIGGDIPKGTDLSTVMQGNPFAYKAFYHNTYLQELYLPDSVVEIGFKSMEHCKSLQVLSFSNKMKTLGINAINGCTALKKIIYRGTIYEFSNLKFTGQTPNLDVVYCTDGQIRFDPNRQYYIDTLYFPGTRAEWEAKHPADDWRNKRCKRIVCVPDPNSSLLDFAEQAIIDNTK